MELVPGEFINTISSAGIDVDVFKANSSRSVSSREAKQVGIAYIEILKSGSWKGAHTSTKHYNKHIINKDDLADFNFVTPIVGKFKEYTRLLYYTSQIYKRFGLIHAFRNWKVALRSSAYFETSYRLLSLEEQ